MTTTIKVSSELRDRLKAQASRDGVTLSAHLQHLADFEDRRRRMESLRAAIAATGPAEWSSWVEESSDWEHTELSDSAS
ncbi:hypothetical protein [Arthrobacter woluwensis]